MSLRTKELKSFQYGAGGLCLLFIAPPSKDGGGAGSANARLEQEEQLVTLPKFFFIRTFATVCRLLFDKTDH